MFVATFSERVTSIAQLYGLRSLASRWLSDAGADQEAIDTVALVLSEACTNAFTHGRTDAVDVEMKIENTNDGDEAAIVLSTRHVDHDLARLALPQPTMPAPDAPQGRGLALVGRLVDRMTLRIDPPKVTRTCWVPRVAQQS